MTTIRIGALLPATFNLNADVANASIVVRRLALSGYDAEVVLLDEPSKWGSVHLDALIIGSPSSSTLADPALPRDAIALLLRRLLDERAPILAVSNGMHLLGTMTGRDGSDLGGLGVLPIHTDFGSVQHVTIGASVERAQFSLIGVENHNATVTLGDGVDDFADLVRGTGNGKGGGDGVEFGSLIGTHLHGPLFALNPDLADEFCRGIQQIGRQFAPSGVERLNELSNAARAHLLRQASS